MLKKVSWATVAQVSSCIYFPGLPVKKQEGNPSSPFFFSSLEEEEKTKSFQELQGAEYVCSAGLH